MKHFRKRILITGGAGFLGSHLCEHLLKQECEIICVDNYYTGSKNNVSDLMDDKYFELYRHDITFPLFIEVDEIYNLAAQSHVKVSFETAEYTANCDGLGVLRILEAVRLLDMIDKVKIYQASTSELFGKVIETPQTEKTPFYPRSPYGAAKLYAYWIIKKYD